MKKQTIFLKLTLVLFALPVLALCIFAMPPFTKELTVFYLEMPFLQYPILFGIYGTAIAFFVALYQAFKLLTYIDRNEAFSILSVAALKKVKYCAFTISGLYTLGLPFFYAIAEKDDAPGLILVGVAFIIAAMGVAIFAAILQKLLENAIEMKAEIELTV